MMDLDIERMTSPWTYNLRLCVMGCVPLRAIWDLHNCRPTLYWSPVSNWLRQRFGTHWGLGVVTLLALASSHQNTLGCRPVLLVCFPSGKGDVEIEHQL